MISSVLNERCRLGILKLRGIAVSKLEGKVIQYILMKNKQLHTLDLSFCKAELPEHFEFFMQKFDNFCNIRFLTMESMQPDLSTSIEVLGEALALNTKLECLILRDNKIKWIPYSNFWQYLIPNKTLRKINVAKTELTDKVLTKLV